ncbi:hypothetical protein N8912_01920 [Rhodobacteraceae bacterium]|nr:hypothetical protein [Paracoccaceae bacterium]MBT6297624.1 hypothetical protein [Paracoccaceae bacterium]MBT6546178.1 hypothetical protein [Paracoccaceae bacterium]MDA7777000.1 hypothetical protein [Paracoccaceae bacterium]MDB3911447.1 hypothetical protein [Paracoccaceae bacterium]
MDEPFPGTAFFKPFQKFDFYGDILIKVTLMQSDSARLPKGLLSSPALLLLGLIISLQRHRQTVPAF